MLSPTNPVLGKYRILFEISSTGCKVYNGINPSVGRQVAIKELVLSQRLSANQRTQRTSAFDLSTLAAMTLKHRNIATVYDSGVEDDSHVVITEYLEGTTLNALLRQDGALPTAQSLDIAVQISEALTCAHAQGIMHGGVAPDKVYITPSGVVKLVDFGIAKIGSDPSHVLRDGFGNVNYMSPEQLSGGTVDVRTDMFSLAAVVFEMLTGDRLFPGDDTATVANAIINSQPEMPATMSARLQRILLDALAIDPSRRYPSMALMGVDLRDEQKALSAPSSSGPMIMAVGPATLDTGRVPAHISGIPAQMIPPAAPAPPPYQPPPGPGVAPPYSQFPSQPGAAPPPPPYPGGAQGPRPANIVRTANRGPNIGLVVAILVAVCAIAAAIVWFDFGPPRQSATDPGSSAGPTVGPRRGAGGPQAIYTGSFQNGWEDYSWAKVNAASTDVVHNSRYSMSVKIDPAYSGAFFHHADFEPSKFKTFSFWINGGPNGANRLFVCGVLGGKTAIKERFVIPPLQEKKWVHVRVPLNAINVYGQNHFSGFFIQDDSGKTGIQFYVDDVRLD